MGIHDALKRAQEERDRAREARNPPEGQAAQRPEPSEPAGPARTEAPIAAALEQTRQVMPAAGGVPPAVASVAAAIKQGEVSTAGRAAVQLSQTIVEDYASKQQLNLPPAMVVYHDRTGPVAEQYRRLRNVLLGDHPTAAPSPRLWVVSSAGAGEGKTTAVLNLGLSLVEIRALRVLLVDADLQHGGLTHLLKAEHDKGLAQMLQHAGAEGGPGPETYLKATPWHNLYLLPAGATGTAGWATGLLQGPAARPLLRSLRNRFDAVVVDTPAASVPPLPPCPDAGLLAAGSDGVLLVVPLRQAKRAAVQRTLRMFASLNVPVRGTVLTRHRS